MNLELTFQILGWISVGAPLALLAGFLLSLGLGIRLAEPLVAGLTRATILLGLVSTGCILALMLTSGSRFVPLTWGDWAHLQHGDFEFNFRLKFNFDRLSIPFTLLVYILCGTINEFARRYLHREPGFHRFYLLYALFLAGMVVASLAGTIETLFMGWEFVGLSSALLVAYFHERENPVRNGLRVWSVYRLADAAFLVAALLMHHREGHGDFAHFAGSGGWPSETAGIGATSALTVGLLLLLAAAGKSALFPFSGWLPRAMEGPTPSSAIFYGALSVHLGVYLLLRFAPLLEVSLVLRICVISIGVLTALTATLTARVQSDVKSSLAYASLTQVGIIVVETGCGFYYLALVHLLGHACLRTLQLLRAPTLLRDYQQLENAIGAGTAAGTRGRSPGGRWQGLYHFGLERGYSDTLLDGWVVRPFRWAFSWADRQERRWTDWISGEPSRESDRIELHPEAPEEDR